MAEAAQQPEVHPSSPCQSDTRAGWKSRAMKPIVSRAPQIAVQSNQSSKSEWVLVFGNRICQQYVAWKFSFGLLLILHQSQPRGAGACATAPLLQAEAGNLCWQIIALFFSSNKVDENIMVLVKMCQNSWVNPSVCSCSGQHTQQGASRREGGHGELTLPPCPGWCQPLSLVGMDLNLRLRTLQHRRKERNSFFSPSSVPH